MQWFANDGGPMLVLPRAAVPVWEGADPPTRDGVIAAVTRWDGGTFATDYDRACDAERADGPAAAIPVAGSWGIVLPGELAGSAAWLPGADAEAAVVVAVAAVDDDSPGFLRRAYAGVGPDAWRPVHAGLDVGPGGFLLLHAASAGLTVTEGAHGADGVAVIGDALAADAAPGRYLVEAAEIELPEAGLLFCRFRSMARPEPSGTVAPAA